MRLPVIFFAIVVAAWPQTPSERIGTIDFYGYGTLDIAVLRAALPFKEGDRVPDDKKRDAAEESVSKAAGREVRISGACCLPDGRNALFIGVAEADAPKIEYNAAPAGMSTLPPEAKKILQEIHDNLFNAVKNGRGGEDDSQGYALTEDPTLHAAQLKLRAWAVDHAGVIMHVLEDSRDAQQRQYAAEALGYAERSPRQIAALVRAAFDPSDNVRNPAVRALEVLCTLGTEVTRQIPVERFLPLLHSIVWTDRNKGSILFSRMTESRDPGLLSTLRLQALTPLREMAQWKSAGHAYTSLEILGRIAGIEETRLRQLIFSKPSEILDAVK
jgi:hypothetical protein